MVAGALEGADGKAVRSRLSGWVQDAIEAQSRRLFLWAPIFLTFGIWLYFALAREPSAVAVAGLAVMILPLLWFGRTRPVLMVAALLAIGFMLAKTRSDIVTAPLLRATTPEVLVTGIAASIDKSTSRRLVLIVEPELIEGLAPDRTPTRLRLSLTPKLGQPRAGDRIAFKARLSPLPSPVAPGGFDYGRKLWFERIGATGRVTGAISVIGADTAWRYRFERAMTDLRHAIGTRIHAQLDGTIASFAEALVTGERATIPKDVNQSLLVSGLFHVLSISGLHMWMVAGGVFWAVRAALALSPFLALRFPIKKWAAMAAVLIGWFYMVLADSGVATERSFIMIAVVFLAVLVDRPALSTRNLAIAALIVLLFNPEAAVDAGFQMSFLAVLGLVAFYEYWSRRNRDDRYEAPRHWTFRLARAGVVNVVLALATTAVASSVSSIPAAYHFGRLAPYGLIANGLAFPVIGILVMPFALAGTLLMPFGLEALPLWVMGEGLKLVLAISDWVAAFPRAAVIVAQPSGLSMAVLAGGAVTFCLLAGAARWIGLPIAMIGLALAVAGEPGPDILVETYGGNVAFRNSDGQLVPALARKGRFAVEKWLQVNGETTTPSDAAKRPGWTCMENRCDAVVRGKKLTYVTGDNADTLDCAGIDILVASFPLRRHCRSVPVRIDRFDVWRGGAHAIRIGKTGIMVETARAGQGNRPWTVVPEARKDVFKPR